MGARAKRARADAEKSPSTTDGVVSGESAREESAKE